MLELLGRLKLPTRLAVGLAGGAVVAGGMLAAPALSASASTTAVVHTAARTASSTAGYGFIKINPTNLTKPYSAVVTREPLTGTYKLCTRSGATRCATGEGDGFSMKIYASGYSTFNESAGDDGEIFTTPNGLCVHGTDTGAIIGSSSACGATNTASQWFTSSDSPPRWINYAYVTASSGGYMAVTGNSDGAFLTLAPYTGYSYLSRYSS
jgi:hypothetical protein